ncbi:FAD-binding domain-containing protein [Mycena latifolia]|nr:FAD-binding domain-containing protein [Mycena latifolia]
MLVVRSLVSIASLIAAISAQDAWPSASISSNTTAALTSASSKACAAIRVKLGSSIVKSSGLEYNATVMDPWSLFNSLDRPTCIVYPRTVSHVQAAMKSIFRFSSHYAVQAGAHSTMVGWNTISNGVLISFANMTNVSYCADTETVTVLPGVHWGDAMTAVEPYGISVIGGRASDVGMGLLLGGGISFVSPLYDLFRALKGGANRFGIVTRYELYPAHTGTNDQKRWFGGNIVDGKYPGSSSVVLISATARYIREVTDPKAGLIVIMNAMDLTALDTHVVYLFYKGAHLPKSIFGDFLSIPSTSQSLSALSYFDMSNLIPGNARGNGQQFGASAWVGDRKTFLSGYNHFINFTRTFESERLTSHMIISPIPRSQWTAAPKARGANAIGDPGVSYATINFYLIYPAGVTMRPKNVNAGFQLLLSQTPPSPGLPLYINECDASQSVYKTYPAFKALKKTYAKYDPSRFNVEHTAGPIGL